MHFYYFVNYNMEKIILFFGNASILMGMSARIEALFGGILTSFFLWKFGFLFELVILTVIFPIFGKHYMIIIFLSLRPLTFFIKKNLIFLDIL